MSETILANFKKPERFFGNDMLPATMTPHKGRVYVKWDNGHSCTIDKKLLNIKHIRYLNSEMR